MYDRDDSAPSLLSFLIGGIIGASLTCLLAPQSGIALRRRIGKAVGGGARKGRTAAGRIERAVRSMAGEASEVLIGEGAGSGGTRQAARASRRRASTVPNPGLPTIAGDKNG